MRILKKLTEYKYTITNLWTGKVYEVKDPICLRLCLWLSWAWIIGWAPLWIPLHVILRILGRQGFCKVENNCIKIMLTEEGFKKVGY